jgi:hypothetical protein
MGVAIDTVLAFATAGAASPFPTALGTAAGDSLTIRNFVPPAKARVESLIYSAGGAQKVRILSPMLHDNVTGLTFEPAEIPAMHLFPRQVGVPMVSGDTLVAQGGIAAAGTIVAALSVYYDNLNGQSARLHSWADIKGNIKAIKSVEVDLLAVAVGAWTDTLITQTENQLHAHSDYAVLGYTPNTAIDVLGVKGQETGNLRICGPGNTQTLDVTEYFVSMSEQQGTPHIPVFNADNRGSFYVSAAHHAAVGGGAEHAYLILAELATPLAS